MSIVRRLMGLDRETRSNLANPSPWLVDALSGPSTVSGQRVDLDRALTLTAFRSAVKLISETVGILPLKVYRDQDGDKFEARGHRTWRMLHDRPNPSTSAHRFWSAAAAQYLIFNNVFIEKLRGQSGLVEELWLRDPRCVKVYYDDGLKMKAFREDTTYGVRRWTDETMLHVCGWSVNGLVGESELYRGRQTIGNALAREEFEGSFYKNGAILAGVIEHPGRLGDTAAKRLREYFKNRYGGTRNAGGTPVLEEGAKYHGIGANMADLDFEKAQERTRTEIAVMFNLPPSFLGGSTGDSLTYATVESNMIQFVQHAVSPVTSALQSALSADPGLFPFPSWFAEYELNGLLRADSQARANFYKIMHEIGALTTNEIRAMENKAPLEEEPVDEVTVPPPGEDVTTPDEAVTDALAQ